MIRPQRDVLAFHRKFGHPYRTFPGLPDWKVLHMRQRLIREETNELCRAMEEEDLVGVVQESVDVAYVAIGNLVACGIDFAAIWQEVHRANMEKVPDPGKGLTKPRKPEGWVPPRVKDSIEHQRKRGDIYQYALESRLSAYPAGSSERVYRGVLNAFALMVAAVSATYLLIRLISS